MSEDFSDTEPSLHDLARRAFRFDSEISDRTVTEALRRAEIDPSDENERHRFRRLVVAEREFWEAEQRAEIGEFIDQAAEQLSDTATQEEIVALGRELYHRQKMREWEQEMYDEEDEDE